MDVKNKFSLQQINCAFCAIATVLLVVTSDVYGDSGIWHKRDHSDQIRPEMPEAHVVTTREGMIYLIKYGYLKGCILPPRRLKRFIPDGPVKAGDSGTGVVGGTLGQICTQTMISDALRRAQETFHIEQTGKFDKATMDKMNSRRCGNSDDSITKEEKTKDTESQDKNLDTSDKGSAHLHKRSVHNQLWPQPGSVDSADDFPRQAVKNSEKQTKSLLLDVLTRSAVDDGLYIRGISARRKRYLHTYVNKVSEDKMLRDRSVPSSTKSRRLSLDQLKDLVHIRAKRSNFMEGSGSGVKFTKSQVHWRLLQTQYSHYIPVDTVGNTLRLSFRMWGEVSPLKFLEDNLSDLEKIDIEIGFGSGSHMGCPINFDGKGGVVAHSWRGGDIHIDDAENYRFDNEDGLNLAKVVLHEIGHVLSLNHSEDMTSIMYPIYTQNVQPGALELRKTDRSLVQQVYGVCKGKFTTVFDILRLKGRQWYYYSYFFRDAFYWNYENLQNRPRYGDPLLIVNEWSQFPKKVDAAVQVLYQDMTTKWMVNHLYVFHGEEYSVYDVSQGDIRLDNYPKRISQGFGPKKGQTESVPSNLDSVLFDWRNDNLYFFKGEWVWIYDVNAPLESRGCCEGKKRFVEMFPTEQGSGQVLTGNVDSAYFSFKYNTVFFFKNEDIYMNKLYNWQSRTHTQNLLKPDGKWYSKWHDICEV